MQVTYKRAIDFRGVASQYLQAAGDERSEVTKALGRMQSRTEFVIEDYKELLRDIRIDNASLDARGNLLRDEKGEYVYAPAAEKAVFKGVRKLLETDTASFEPLIVPVPADFPEELIEVFEGFIFNTQAES